MMDNKRILETLDITGSCEFEEGGESFQLRGGQLELYQWSIWVLCDGTGDFEFAHGVTNTTAKCHLCMHFMQWLRQKGYLVGNITYPDEYTVYTNGKHARDKKFYAHGDDELTVLMAAIHKIGRRVDDGQVQRGN